METNTPSFNDDHCTEKEARPVVDHLVVDLQGALNLVAVDRLEVADRLVVADLVGLPHRLEHLIFILQFI